MVAVLAAGPVIVIVTDINNWNKQYSYYGSRRMGQRKERRHQEHLPARTVTKRACARTREIEEPARDKISGNFVATRRWSNLIQERELDGPDLGQGVGRYAEN